MAVKRGLIFYLRGVVFFKYRSSSRCYILLRISFGSYQNVYLIGEMYAYIYLPNILKATSASLMM